MSIQVSTSGDASHFTQWKTLIGVGFIAFFILRTHPRNKPNKVNHSNNQGIVFFAVKPQIDATYHKM